MTYVEDVEESTGTIDADGATRMLGAVLIIGRNDGSPLRQLR